LLGLSNIKVRVRIASKGSVTKFSHTISVTESVHHEQENDLSESSRFSRRNNRRC
jgi:hypothetical protein